MSLRIGVDVGGTFTDVALAVDGSVVRGKADTTHYDLKVGFLHALEAAARRIGLDVAEVLRRADLAVYSTTVGTNALIERKGPRLGLITTRGFEDTIIVGRSRNWADGLPIEARYDRGRARRPEPLIPRQLICGVRERVDNLGRVLMPLQRADVLEQVQRLVDQGVRGFVVVLLHAYANPRHEREIREIIREEYPEAYLGHMPIFLSGEISPQIGEYRRAMTVILDAFLRVETEEHLLRLTEELRDLGYRRPLFVAKNTGGISSLSRTQPLHLYGSSPCASVVGGDHVGRQLGRPNVLIADMGGTSLDIGLVVEGRDRVYELDPVIGRWRVQIPYVAHWSIGAGGGSIAHLQGAVLRVGPESAGSNPGPACYARGGERPTVTDADVVLGYIDPDLFLGGRYRLDRSRAEQAIAAEVAEPLGLGLDEAAWSIKRLVDGTMGQEMYRATALISGDDPRAFTMLALGGAGPLHATGIAEYADVREIVSLPFGSVFGAYGTLHLDILQTYDKSVRLVLAPAGDRPHDAAAAAASFNAEVEGLLELAGRDMEEEGFDPSLVRLQIEAHMAYGQQRHSLAVPVPGLRLGSEADLRALCGRFNDRYAASFGRGSTFPEAGIEVVRIRLNAVGPLPKLDLRPVPGPAGGLAAARRGERPAYWGPETGRLPTPVFERDALPTGAELAGPALVEADDCVVAVSPGWRYRTDERLVGWIEKLSP